VGVTLAGVQVAITQSPNGKYAFDVGNFSGAAGSQRIYGCDGINKGFEFDGETFAPIVTGTTPDTPSSVAVHKDSLVWAINSSLIISGPAPYAPFDYTTTNGAAEIAVGANITGLSVQAGAQDTGTLAIFTRDTTMMLYGTSVTDWNLVTFNTGAGASAFSAQNMAQTYYFNSFGITSLAATLNFGNFDQSSLTANLATFVSQQKTLVTCSVLCRSKNQYRVFFSNGYALYMTMVNNTYMGSIPCYFSTPTDGSNVGFYNAFGTVLTTGEEMILMCGYDGYLYRAEKGTSFDGGQIGASMTLTYDFMGSPRILKRFRKAAADIAGTSYTEFQFSWVLGYNSNQYAQPDAYTYESTYNSAQWDSGVSWDTSGVVWDGSAMFPSELDMVGSAENVAITIQSSVNYAAPITVNSFVVHYSPRRGMR
jgi:hypothetical protein